MAPHSTQHTYQMKTSFYLTAFCLVSLSAFLLYSKFETNKDGISISISNTDDTYQFDASFNRINTSKVQDYINRSIEPNSLFKSDNDYFNVTTILTDKTKFHIKESPGSVKIEFDKRKNSSASFIRIKNMCDGIKNILAGK